MWRVYKLLVLLVTVPLGLSDAALLTTVSSTRPLLTVDLELYLRAVQREDGAAFNFRHDPLS